MTLLQKIPTLPDTTDQFISVELGGNPYVLRILWNERFGYFSLSVYEADNTPILINIKIVKNYNITHQFKDTRLPYGDFYFVQEKGGAARPGYTDLSTNCNLYYYESDAVATAQIVRGS
jgi:hypothetical protein